MLSLKVQEIVVVWSLRRCRCDSGGAAAAGQRPAAGTANPASALEYEWWPRVWVVRGHGPPRWRREPGGGACKVRLVAGTPVAANWQRVSICDGALWLVCQPLLHLHLRGLSCAPACRYARGSTRRAAPPPLV